MKRSHRVALKPTPEQESLFGQHAGYARFAYNWAVGEFKAGLDVGEWLPDQTLRPRWNVVKGIIAPWGTALSQNAAKYAIIDLGQAADAWGAHRKRVKAGQRSGSTRRLSEVQASEARAGIPRRQWTGHRARGRQGGDPAEDRPGGDGGGTAVPRVHP